jgi:hypothetical protein
MDSKQRIFQMSFLVRAAKAASSPSPRVVWWLVRFGLFAALVLSLVVAAYQFEAKRECGGAFSRGFSNGFDVHRCEVIVHQIGTGWRIRIPLP